MLRQFSCKRTLGWTNLSSDFIVADDYISMMNSTLHAPSIRYTSYLPATLYSYDPQVALPLLPREYFALDLSKKSSDYKHYPSPKSSPVSYASRDEYECTSPEVKQEKTNPEEFQSRPYAPSLECDRRTPFSSLGSPQFSPRSTISPGSISETSSQPDAPAPSQKKNSRPFKCIGKALFAADYLGSASIIDDANLDSEEIKRLMEESAKKYAEFKEKMLRQLSNNNNSTNNNMRRLQNNDHKVNDAEYLEKRRKNNEAAKKSRDARRNKQDDTAIRATFLEQENIMLRLHLKAEREDLERLRKMESERQMML